MSPQSFGKYQLVRKLATGGMAEVWLARQTGIEGFQRQLVIKRILPHLAEDQEFVQMFLNEAKISVKFSHPNIGQIYDLGHVDGTYFIAMEYIHGDDLGRVMRKAWSSGQWISRPLAIRIVASAAEGLAYAHAKTDDQGRPLKVVHRDISPQNILISFEGSVKLVDFGIAKAADATSMTKSGAIKGKFAYMSPEQAGGKPLDHRSDIFAIGLVLYELLTGVRPLKRDSELATLQAALECAIEPPSQVADVPVELDAVVMRALAKSTQDRYDDARQFQLALEEFLVSQRWVAGSVQIAELMKTLFADRLKEEASGAFREDSASGSLDLQRSTQEGSNPGGSGPLPSPGGRSPAELSWDAPPGASNPQARKPSPRLRSRRPAEAEPAAEEAGTDAGPRPTRAAPPSSASAEAVRSTRAAPEGVSSDSVSTASRPPKRTSSSERRRYSSGVEMPEAPPRMIREPRAPLAPAASSELSAPAPAPSTAGAKKLLVGAMAFAALVGGWAVWGTVLQPMVDHLLGRSQGDAAPIYVRATSNLHCQVLVRHAEPNPPEPVTVLGDTPLEKASGAHLGDTIILENAAQGAHYEQFVELGEPNKVKLVRKEFKMGRVMPNLRNAPSHGLAFYLNGQKVAEYSQRLPFEMVEGTYTLEIRGEALRKPAMLEVHVYPEKTTPTVALDMTPYLDQP